MPTEVAVIETFRRLSDLVYNTGESLLDLEFDSSGKSENVLRFFHYAVLLANKRFESSGEFLPVKTYIVHPGDVSFPSQMFKEGNIINLPLIFISLASIIKSKDIFNLVKEKIELNKYLEITIIDWIKFVLLLYGDLPKAETNNYAIKMFNLVVSLPKSNLWETIFALTSVAVHPIIGKTDVFKQSTSRLADMDQQNLQYLDEALGGFISKHFTAAEARFKAKAEAKVKEAEAKVREAEAKVKEAEAKARAEAEAKIKAEAEAKAEAIVRAKIEDTLNVVVETFRAVAGDSNFSKDLAGTNLKKQ
jgi:hypothetical protein